MNVYSAARPGSSLRALDGLHQTTFAYEGYDGPRNKVGALQCGAGGRAGGRGRGRG